VSAAYNILDWSKTKLSDIDFDKIALFTGHFFYSAVRDKSKDFKKVVIMRDPIERILSEQRYIFDQTHKNPSVILNEHFLSPESTPIESAENIACKLLSQINPFDPTIPIEQHLQSAKETLANEFDFIGITEKMSESIALFFHLMGWNPPEEVPIHNTSNKRSSKPPSLPLDEIAKRNWADIELYEFGKELFEQQKKRPFPRLTDDNIQWVDRIDYDFNQPLDGFGWCPRESLPSGTFRWLWSSERGCIEFPLSDDYGYILDADLLILPALIAKLSFAVNGVKISHRFGKLQPSSDEYQWVHSKAFIPRNLLQNKKKARIEITVEDPDRVPAKDSYRGRCGCRKITISNRNRSHQH